MSKEIEDILEEDEVIEEETQDETETKVEKKKQDLSFMDKPVEEWTTDDAEASRKYALTLKAQKEHFQKKANTTKVEAKPNLLKQETPNLTEEIDIRFLKRDGVSDEDIDQLKFIQAGLKAQGKDVSLMEAQNNELYKAYQSNKNLEAKREKAQLISSGQPLNDEGKPLTDEEFESKRKSMAEGILNRM